MMLAYSAINMTTRVNSNVVPNLTSQASFPVICFRNNRVTVAKSMSLIWNTSIRSSHVA